MKIMDKNSTFVDVRTPGEFAEDHVPGAVNIPLHEISSRIEEFKSMPKPIITYCRSGSRSGMAVSILKKSGIKEALNGGGLKEILTGFHKL